MKDNLSAIESSLIAALIAVVIIVAVALLDRH
jgi:Flp pilus assembly pilin Flp